MADPWTLDEQDMTILTNPTPDTRRKLKALRDRLYSERSMDANDMRDAAQMLDALVEQIATNWGPLTVQDGS